MIAVNCRITDKFYKASCVDYAFHQLADSKACGMEGYGRVTGYGQVLEGNGRGTGSRYTAILVGVYLVAKGFYAVFFVYASLVGTLVRPSLETDGLRCSPLLRGPMQRSSPRLSVIRPEVPFRRRGGGVRKGHGVHRKGTPACFRALGGDRPLRAERVTHLLWG